MRTCFGRPLSNDAQSFTPLPQAVGEAALSLPAPLSTMLACCQAPPTSVVTGILVKDQTASNQADTQKPNTAAAISKTMTETHPRIAYQVHPGGGPFLLMVHGFISSAAQWTDNLAALGEVCRPVTVELWGHGKSPAPTDIAWYYPDSYMLQFEHIRAELGAQTWFTCGYSLGAGLSIRYANEYSKFVRGHIFTNSVSAFADESQIAHWHKTGPKSAADVLAGGIEAINKMPVHPRRARYLSANTRSALMVDTAQLSPLGVANTILATTPNTSIRDIAATNAVPALMCHGSKEKRFMDYKNWAQKHMRNLSIVSLEAGHGVNMEQPDDFNAAVITFIRRHTTDA